MERRTWRGREVRATAHARWRFELTPEEGEARRWMEGAPHTPTRIIAIRVNRRTPDGRPASWVTTVEATFPELLLPEGGGMGCTSSGRLIGERPLDDRAWAQWTDPIAWDASDRLPWGG